MSKILYLDCGMGAAGDMLSAALFELLPDKASFLEKLNSLGLEDIEFVPEKSVRAGITGTHMKVLVKGREEDEHMHDHGHHHDHEHMHDHGHHHDHGHTHEHDHDHDHPHDHEHTHEHDHDHDHPHEHTHHHDHPHDHEHTHEHDHPHDHHHDHDHGHEHSHDHHGHDHGHEHHHAGPQEIAHIVSHLEISEKVKKDVLGVYDLIAAAESSVHGVSIDQIHFHEVGTMDAVADITACCLMMESIGADEIYASPVRTGSGTVKCAHGILPVPAPATAKILAGIPVYAGDEKGEMCTPTGAALLKYFVKEFRDMPLMTITSSGYGMGKKEFQTANCVRALLGDSAENGKNTDSVLELSFNVDDMTAEEISFVMDRLFDAGAKEVFTVPCGMKKSRPGTLVSVLCAEADRDRIRKEIFTHTTTIGIREAVMKRYILDRRIETEETPYGCIRKKISTGYGVTKTKYEYDDLSQAAAKNGLTLKELKEKLK